MPDLRERYIIHALASDLINIYEEDPEALILMAKVCVQNLIDNRVLTPSERFTETCPRCQEIIADHLVTGACPDLTRLALNDILVAYRDDDPLALANALDRLDMADRESAP